MFVRENSSILIETFMEKYIYNTVELEIDSEDVRREEENKAPHISEEGTFRN